MIRKIINIDREKCNGCGKCVDACHEGAIGIINGKAELLRDDYCDGLGDCLPVCPTGAITFVQREAAQYNEQAVKSNMLKQTTHAHKCPGSNIKVFNQDNQTLKSTTSHMKTSELGQWPIQIKLVPVNAPFFKEASLLIAADCTAYAYGNFHDEFIKGRITLIGCPKLDTVDYSDKLTQILNENDIKSISIVRMQVPYCEGIVNAVKTAIKNSGKLIPWNVTVVSAEGEIISRL